MLNSPSVQHAIVKNSRLGAQEVAPLAQTAMSHAAREICIVLVAWHPVDERKHVVEAVNVHGILRVTSHGIGKNGTIPSTRQMASWLTFG